MTAEIDRLPAVRRLRHRPGSTVRDPVAVPVGPQRIDPPANGLEASAPTLRALFEEAAAALIRMTAVPGTAGPACRWETISLRALDLSGLAGAWLDRLLDIGERRYSDDRREAIVMVVVDRVASPDEDAEYRRWTLRARVGLRPYRPTAESSSVQVRCSASDRPLAVEQAAGAWRLQATLAL